MKIAVFTAAIGSKTDQVKPPTVVTPGVDYIAFVTGDHLVPAPWSPVRIGQPRGDVPESWAVRQARLVKIQCDHWLPGYDYTLWIDAAYRLDVDVLELLKEMPAGVDVCALEHPDRSNVAEEGAELVRLGMVEPSLIAAQIATFDGFPERQTRLTSTGFLLRRHSARVSLFNEQWVHELEHGGHQRDQMSVDVCAESCGITLHYLRGHYRDNPYAKWFPNRRRRN